MNHDIGCACSACELRRQRDGGAELLQEIAKLHAELTEKDKMIEGLREALGLALRYVPQGSDTHARALAVLDGKSEAMQALNAFCRDCLCDLPPSMCKRCQHKTALAAAGNFGRRK